MASSIVIMRNLAIFVLVLTTASCSASEMDASSRITNFTIGAVLSDERHDTLFREAITVSVTIFSLFSIIKIIYFSGIEQRLHVGTHQFDASERLYETRSESNSNSFEDVNYLIIQIIQVFNLYYYYKVQLLDCTSSLRRDCVSPDQGRPLSCNYFLYRRILSHPYRRNQFQRSCFLR